MSFVIAFYSFSSASSYLTVGFHPIKLCITPFFQNDAFHPVALFTATSGSSCIFHTQLLPLKGEPYFFFLPELTVQVNSLPKFDLQLIENYRPFTAFHDISEARTPTPAQSVTNRDRKTPEITGKKCLNHYTFFPRNDGGHQCAWEPQKKEEICRKKICSRGVKRAKKNPCLLHCRLGTE